jgi:hypothetical protein
MTFSQRVILALIASGGVVLAALIAAGSSFLQSAPAEPAVKTSGEQTGPDTQGVAVRQTAEGVGIVQNAGGASENETTIIMNAPE